MKEDTAKTNVKAAAADFAAARKQSQRQQNQHPQTKPMPTTKKQANAAANEWFNVWSAPPHPTNHVTVEAIHGQYAIE